MDFRQSHKINSGLHDRPTTSHFQDFRPTTSHQQQHPGRGNVSNPLGGNRYMPSHPNLTPNPMQMQSSASMMSANAWLSRNNSNAPPAQQQQPIYQTQSFPGVANINKSYPSAPPNPYVHPSMIQNGGFNQIQMRPFYDSFSSLNKDSAMFMDAQLSKQPNGQWFGGQQSFDG